MRKRFLSILMVFSMVLAMIPATALADNTVPIRPGNVISTNGYYTGVIDENGILWTWGNSIYNENQLGNGAVDGSNVPVRVLENVVSFVREREFNGGTNAAITADGSLWMWGENNLGQLGNGTTEDSSVPIKVLNDVGSVSLGGTRTAAVTADGGLWTWGNGGNSIWSMLGNGTQDGSLVPIKIMDGVASVSCGYNHTAALKTDGSLWLWGDGSSLGNGESKHSPIPIKIMDDVTYVDAGYGTTVAIKTDGSLWTWGRNWCGELGNGSKDSSLIPIKIMDSVASATLYKSFDCPNVAAIKTDGSLWIWGDNNGRIGNGTDEDSSVPVRVLGNVSSIAMGNGHAAAIKTDGSLWMWGWNRYGQLGIGSTQDSLVPVKVMDDVAVVDVEVRNTFVGKKDKTLWVFGENEFGALGLGDNSDQIETPIQNTRVTVNVSGTGGSGSDNPIPDGYALTYDLNGGKGEILSECWPAGERVIIISNVPTKDGYTFKGWSDGSNMYQPSDTFTMPDRDVTLMAVWEKSVSSYYLTYDLGDVGPYPATSHQAGETIVIPSGIPEKDGYIFKGWSDGDTTYQPGDTFAMPEHDVTMTAIWEEFVGSYFLTYDLGGVGPYPATSHQAGETIVIPSDIPVKDGYIFNGWSDGNTTYQPNDSFAMPDHNVTLTAVWAAFVGPVQPIISIARNSIILMEGKTATPRVSLIKGATVEWNSDNSSIARVNTSGTVVGVSVGTATITGNATLNGKTETCSYTVEVTPSIKVTFKDEIINLQPGKSARISYTVCPKIAQVTLSSSNPNVVTISDNAIQAVGTGTAIIQAVGTGTATITAHFQNSSFESDAVKNNCIIKVGLSDDELAERFIDEALKYVGYSGTDFYNAVKDQLKQFEDAADYKLSTGNWCSDFIGICAKLTGIAKIIPKESAGWKLSDKIVGAGGKVVDTPKKGDIVTFQTTTGYGHVGIVCNVDNKYVYIINGNWHGHVCAPKGYGVENCINEVKYGSTCGKWEIGKWNQQAIIERFTRPNWGVVSGVNSGELDILAECPIDMRYTYDGEVLDSATEQFEASFGTMERTDDGGIFVHLNDYYNVGIEINGTGAGTMNLTSTFRDANGTTSTRKFQDVPISEDTIGKLYAYDSADTEILELYKDYGKTFVEAWAVDGNETVSSANKKLTDWYINGGTSGDVRPEVPTVPEQPTVPNYSSNDSSSDPTYSISVPTRTTGGTVKVTPTSASENQRVTITVKPNYGYTLDNLTVTDSKGNELDLTDQGDGKYTFRMPGSKVSVIAVFQLTEKPWSNLFQDVASNAWYYNAVKFVSENNLMNGYSSNVFAPNAELSRAMLVQILYNKAGRPSVTRNRSFIDVSDGAWYTNAVIWAVTNGIVSGYGDGTFAPDDNVTREQLATMLWRYAGSPVPMNQNLHFADMAEISGFAQDALRWASENGIVNGIGNNMVAPKATATRAQVAQMLENFLGK